MERGVQVEVDLSRVVRNAMEVGARVGVEVWGTIKADAYGLGAGRVAEALGPEVAGFCVFALEEAVGIDLWKRTGKGAIALGPPATLDAREWIEAHVRPAVSNVEEARALREARPILCVDTGMQRFACGVEEIGAVLAAGGLDEAFTHATRVEHAQRLRLRLGGRGVKLHAAATALLDVPEARLDAVRPGLAMYRGALRVCAPLWEVRRSNGPIGYTGWISPTGYHGVIAVGYAAGLRAGPVMINGRRQRVTEVGMQSAYVTVESTDKVGDRVVLVGDGVTEGEVAGAWGCTEHEVVVRMAGMGERVTRA